MSFVNHASKQLILKIAYCGPGLSGKTTNVQYIYDHTDSKQHGKLTSLSTENERTLFFDFLPLSVGEVMNGFETRFHIFSIPGQTFYESARDFILKGIDGLVFVADSQEERMSANIESYELLEKSLERHGYDINRLPVVFQYNKRDVKGVVSVQEMEATFNAAKRPHFEAIASRGVGVMETLQAVSELVIRDLRT
ncbi:MAG: ATP/GTP-binding protein [Bacteriovoracia bacterium]